MAVEPYSPKTLGQSKIYDLLKDFELTACYRNPFLSGFALNEFLSACEEIEVHWGKRIFSDA